jgi:hypothetical protein
VFFLACAIALSVAGTSLVIDQAVAADFNPKLDLRVTFSSEGTETGAGFVVGHVKNVSTQDFSCIVLDFGLSTRFDQRQKGQPSHRLGTLPVEVRNLGSRTTVFFREALPFPAGFGLNNIRHCETDTAQDAALPRIVSFRVTPNPVQRGEFVSFFWEVRNADRVRLFDDFGEIETRNMLPNGEFGWPLSESGAESMSVNKATIFKLVAENRDGRETTSSVTVRLVEAKQFCTVLGRVTGTPVQTRLLPNGPIETFELKQVGVFVPGERTPKFKTRVDRHGQYRFRQLPAGQEFRVAPLGWNWRYDRRNERVSCGAGQSLRVNFHIVGVFVD